MSTSLLFDVAAVVLDIEGTTTPMTFVKDKLFPYVRVNLRTYLEKNFDLKETQDDINSLRRQAEEDRNAGLEATFPVSVESDREKVIDTVERNVLWQMDLDRKTTALKQLQGHILQNGYSAGDILGEVYNDVPRALKRLIHDGVKIYTYSSGSIGAQKLLFGYSTHGNLLELFSDQFDTTIGAKVEKESYTKIAASINLSPQRILFLTDIPKEAEAARAAQFKTCLVVREGNAPLSETDEKSYPTVHSFDELFS